MTKTIVLEHIARFLLLSSGCTSRSAIRFSRIIVPKTSEVHRHEQGDENQFGQSGREYHRWFLERRRQQNSFRRLDRVQSFPHPRETSTKSYKWGHGRLTEHRLTTRPDSVRPESWTTMSNKAKKAVGQNWEEEEHTRDAARQQKRYLRHSS